MAKSVLNKVVKFGEIAKALEVAGIDDITVNGETFSAIDFITNEVDLIERKNANAKSKKKDNSLFEERIAEILGANGGCMSATEIFKEDVETLGSIQKVVSCLKGMSNVERVAEGKKVTFRLV